MGPATFLSEKWFMCTETTASAPSVHKSSPRRRISSFFVSPKASLSLRVTETCTPSSSSASFSSMPTARFSSSSRTPVSSPRAPASKPPWPQSNTTRYAGGVTPVSRISAGAEEASLHPRNSSKGSKTAKKHNFLIKNSMLSPQNENLRTGYPFSIPKLRRVQYAVYDRKA